ncbi:MAG: hypothetical protein GY853_10115 [PVC group bacterium]|nr:hypothetical protein [PVC group bacterium]
MKSIETKLSHWKAVLNNTSRDAVRAYAYCDGMVDGLNSALSSINEPCNNQLKIGTCTCKFEKWKTTWKVPPIIRTTYLTPDIIFLKGE